mmetsp:Transcript_110497/g.276661  ORF Transcript_110497/g.276661 Transcript_110497/m.276661 type:complete len:240 (+) Transcript_110497:1079-1798(+)
MSSCSTPVRFATAIASGMVFSSPSAMAACNSSKAARRSRRSLAASSRLASESRASTAPMACRNCSEVATRLVRTARKPPSAPPPRMGDADDRPKRGVPPASALPSLHLSGLATAASAANATAALPLLAASDACSTTRRSSSFSVCSRLSSCSSRVMARPIPSSDAASSSPSGGNASAFRSMQRSDEDGNDFGLGALSLNCRFPPGSMPTQQGAKLLIHVKQQSLSTHCNLQRESLHPII